MHSAAVAPSSRAIRITDLASLKGKKLVVVEGAGHFDVVAPWSEAWRAVERAVDALVAGAR